MEFILESIIIFLDPKRDRSEKQNKQHVTRGKENRVLPCLLISKLHELG